MSDEQKQGPPQAPTQPSTPAVRPAEKPTTELERVPPWAISLTEKVQSGFAHVNAEIATLSENHNRFGTRLTRMELRLDEVDERIARNSTRVREPSQHDLDAKTQLAQERAAREELTTKVDDLTRSQSAQSVKLAELTTSQAKQTEMLAKNTALTEKLASQLTGALKHPAVIAFGLALITFLTSWLSRHTP